MATSPQVLPFTLLLIPVGVYWLLALVGTVDLDFLDIDLDTGTDNNAEVDGPGGPGEHGPSDHGAFMSGFHGALRAVNATDVPIMIVLSILIVMTWGCAGIGNLLFNEAGSNFRGTMIGAGAFVAGLVLTRLVTEPLRPMFRAMKGDTKNRPVVGRSGKVRTAELTDRSGQVEIEEKGEVLLLNARLRDGAEPLARGAEVIVYGYDQETGIYYVKNLTTS